MACWQLLFPPCRTLVMGCRTGTAPIISALLGALVCDKSWMHVPLVLQW